MKDEKDVLDWSPPFTHISDIALRKHGTLLSEHWEP